MFEQSCFDGAKIKFFDTLAWNKIRDIDRNNTIRIIEIEFEISK